MKFTHTAHRNTVLVNCNSEIGVRRDRNDALLKKPGVLISKERGAGPEIDASVNQLFRLEEQTGIPLTVGC